MRLTKFIIISISSLILFSSNQAESIESQINEPVFPTTSLKETCLILLWTKLDHGDWMKYWKNICSLNCSVTYDRSLFNESRAVVFHLENIHTKDLPQEHLDGQFWILQISEPPYQFQEQLKAIEKNINWTFTYRIGSDIYHPQGNLVQRNEGDIWMQKASFENKTKEIAWFVSHCDTHSNREEYVQELQKYIPVDIYGKCGSLVCDKKTKKVWCNEMLQDNYKFYLSFENSICKDYVTEKLFERIEYDIIPVVLGGANYSNFMPPNSYIDALNFSHPRELAKFLKQVGSDKDIYNSYFNWKKEKKFKHSSLFCELAEKLLSTPIDASSIKSNLFKWWFEDANCHEGEIDFKEKDKQASETNSSLDLYASKSITINVSPPLKNSKEPITFEPFSASIIPSSESNVSKSIILQLESNLYISFVLAFITMISFLFALRWYCFQRRLNRIDMSNKKVKTSLGRQV